MAFSGEINYLTPQGVAKNAIRMWSYKTDDALSAVAVSGYFNDITLSLRQRDLIVVGGSVETRIYEVTSATEAATVTIAPYNAYTNNAGTPGSLRYISYTTPGDASTKDIVVSEKLRIFDVSVYLKAAGSASDTIQIQTAGGTNDITNAMDISGADKTVVRAGTVDDAHNTIEVGGTIRINQVDGGGNDSPACQVTLLCMNVA